MKEKENSPSGVEDGVKVVGVDLGEFGSSLHEILSLLVDEEGRTLLVVLEEFDRGRVAGREASLGTDVRQVEAVLEGIVRVRDLGEIVTCRHAVLQNMDRERKNRGELTGRQRGKRNSNTHARGVGRSEDDEDLLLRRGHI
jgi:hypothetical protein